MCDVVVVHDTPVLCRLAVIGRPQEVHLIAVPYIRSIQRSPEVRVGLVLVIASAIVVVQVEAHSQPFTRIDTEFRINMVLTILLVTTVVITDVRIGRQRVQIQEILRFLGGIVVGIYKEELAERLAVYEDAVQSGGIVITRRVILPKHSRVIDAVLVKVRHGVQLCLADVSELAVYRPGPYPFGHLLVVFRRVPLVGVERTTVLIPLSDVTKLIHFIIHLSLQLKYSAGYEGE